MTRFIARLAACALVLCSPLCAAQDPGDDPPTLASAAQARLAFEGLVSAYERADLPAVRALLDPGYLGYQRFLHDVQRDFHASRLVRIHLRVPRVTAGTDIVVLQFDWEKRFVNAQTFAPMIAAGRLTVLMHRTAAGWRLAALHGDSPFGPRFPGATPSPSRGTRTPSPVPP